jgi:hypothetical protein
LLLPHDPTGRCAYPTGRCAYRPSVTFFFSIKLLSLSLFLSIQHATTWNAFKVASCSIAVWRLAGSFANIPPPAPPAPPPPPHPPPPPTWSAAAPGEGVSRRGRRRVRAPLHPAALHSPLWSVRRRRRTWQCAQDTSPCQAASGPPMCVCMCMYMYVCVCIHTHIHTHRNMCMYMYMYIRVYTCTHVYVFVSGSVRTTWGRAIT